MNSTKPTARGGAARASRSSALRVVKTTVQEGDMITFGNSGEQLRVSRIADGEIVFEKFP